MSSWIQGPCVEQLHKNLFCRPNLCIVVSDTVHDRMDALPSARDALAQIVLAGDTPVRWGKCGRIAIEDRKTGTIAIYAVEGTR